MKYQQIKILGCIFSLFLLQIIIVTKGVAQNEPMPPVIDSISVDTLPNGAYRCVLGWEPYDWTGYNPDSSGFIVRDVSPLGGYINPDTIYDAFATFYFDSTSNPIDEIQGYGLVAFSYYNGVFVKSEIADQYSQNIQVEIINYDSCKLQTTISWNKYYTNESPISDDPPYRVIAFSNNDYRVETANENQYIFSGLNENEDYTFRIRVLGASFTSTSTPASYYTRIPRNPAPASFVSLETNASFDNTINIKTYPEYTGKLIVFKDTEQDLVFDTLIEQYALTNTIEFVDEIGTGDVANYYVETFNICFEPTSISDTINSIILNANDRKSYIELTANSYQYGEATYSIQRFADGQEVVFGTSAPIQYNDFELLQQPVTDPIVTYRLYAETEDSIRIISNQVKIAVKDDLKWPNAIIAGHYSVDGIFRPFIERTVPEKYNMKIFNKWGQLLFESNSIENGWNGTFKGNYVMPGGYLYVATYKFADTGEKIKKGTVTVIH